MSTALLPPAFADLESLLDAWCLDNQLERQRKLHELDVATVREFYDRMLPRMDAIITHLNQYPLDAMPEAEARLMKLALTFAETAHPVDLNWKTTRINTPFPAERLEITGVGLRW